MPYHEGKEQLPRSIIAIVGPPLSGKTTLGTLLAKKTNAVLFDIDSVRKYIFGERHPQLPPKLEQFSVQTSSMAMVEMARDNLLNGLPSIVTFSCSRPLYHDMLRHLAVTTESPLHAFELKPPSLDLELQRRLVERNLTDDPSNVRDIKTFLSARKRYQTITGVDLVILDGAQPTEQNVQKIISRLKV